MLKINYDVFLGKRTSNDALYVYPVIDNQYVTKKGAFNWNHLCVPQQEEVCWQWWTSELELSDIEMQKQEIIALASPHAMMVQPVLRNGLLKNQNLYIQYLKSLFAPIHCGIERNEMLTKLYGKFVGADWSEDTIGFLRTPLHLDQPLLNCKITVTKGTFQSLLPPYNSEQQRKVDVTHWKPKHSMDYSIIWHLLVTISNGETYKMYFPIGSLNRWQAAMERYFESNPQAILSPDVVIGVTNHSKGYSYESFIETLKFYEDNTRGSSASEILLKLSIWHTFPERQAHLKTALTGNNVTLVFSGNVICEAGI